MCVSRRNIQRQTQSYNIHSHVSPHIIKKDKNHKVNATVSLVTQFTDYQNHNLDIRTNPVENFDRVVVLQALSAITNLTIKSVHFSTRTHSTITKPQSTR